MMRDAKKDLEVCERATPGPWYREKTGANYKGFSTETVIADTCTFATGNKVYTDLEGKGGSFPSDDADFIALAREALPYWISRAMETERLLKKAFEALDALLVCFDNNVRPGFLIEIDDFLRGKYEPEKAEGWGEEPSMMIKTKMKPIIFSGPSIPVIQNLKPGTWPPEPIDPGKPFKWQTRRVVKADIAPYRPGDTLYVREMWKCVRYNNMDGDLQFGVTYKVDGKTIYVEFDDNERYEKFGKFAFKEGWQPSIFMPQEAARLFLEVKNVRLERLQEITEKDARAEGCITFQDKLDGGELLRGVTEFDLTARDAYADLWDSINGKKHPWASNPYVWVYEFMRRERQ